MLFEEVLPPMREGFIVRRPGQFINSFFTIAVRYGSKRLISTHRLDAPWHTVQSFDAMWLDNNWEIHGEDQIVTEKKFS
jgi:hypothetical protein